jgi:single-stranded DNA-binding protein
MSTAAAADDISRNYHRDVGAVAGVYGMIACLISGKLYGDPQPRTGRNGCAFLTAKLRATVAGESLWVSLISFSSSAIEALSALADGDPVSVAGEATLRTWTDKAGAVKPAMDCTVHQVLTPYHVGRKRKAMRSAAPEQPPPADRAIDDPQLELPSAEGSQAAQSSVEEGFDDPLPPF